MRGRILTALSVLMLSVATLGHFNVGAASVTPTLSNDANITCQSLGYDYGLKPTPENAPNGTYLLNNGVDSVTVDNNATGVDSWSSTIGIDAVVVKGGQNGQSNVYTYPSESFGDTNLTTANNPNGQPAGLSHLLFCYDYELSVSKTATPTFDRTWAWSIDKSADQSNLTLSQGQSQTVNYVVAVNTTGSTDSNYGVNGTITIHNPDPTKTATVTSITDQITGLLSTTPVNCSVSLPYVLAAGDTLTCTYSQALSDASSRTNTATVTSTGIPGGSGSANIVFGAPTNQIDECVDVTDSLQGTLGQVCVGDSLPYSFTYSRNIVGTTCGSSTVDNTASFLTNDTAATGSDSWTVNVTVNCVLGCTLTQGYWKTHSQQGPAPYDDTWALLGAQQETATFFLSGKSWYGVFWTAPAGNAYYQLADQYMAAQLNVLNGANVPANVQTALNQAATLFNTYTPAQIAALKGNSTLRQQFVSLAGVLGSYNEGQTGPGHCSE